MIFSNERKGRRGVKDISFVMWNYGRRGCGCPTPTHSSFIRNEINPSTPSLVSTIVVSMVPVPTGHQFKGCYCMQELIDMLSMVSTTSSPNSISYGIQLPNHCSTLKTPICHYYLNLTNCNYR